MPVHAPDLSPSLRRQIVVSGVGGQGVLFLTRLLADAAIARGVPVLTSETHGMAQRGGVVTSHLKAGDFASPLVRSGQGDALLALKSENVPLHRHFVRPGGRIVVNATGFHGVSGGPAVIAVDADGIAREAGLPQAANLVLLGFALADAPEGGALFTPIAEVEAVVRLRLEDRPALLSSSLTALRLGARQAAG